MRRFIIFLLFFSSPFLFATEFRAFSSKDEKFEHWAEYSWAHSFGFGIEKKQNFGSLSYNFKYDVFEGFSGLHIANDVTDLTFRASWNPLIFSFNSSRLDMGLGALYHFQWHSVYDEHDIIANLNVKFSTAKNFLILARLGFGEKVTKIYGLSEKLKKEDPQFSILLKKKFQTGTEPYFSLASHTDYRYPSFCNPTYIFGLGQDFSDWFHLAFEGEFTFTDQFATVCYLESAIFRIRGRFKL